MTAMRNSTFARIVLVGMLAFNKPTNGAGQSALPFPPEGEHVLWRHLFTNSAQWSGRDHYEYLGVVVEMEGQPYKEIRHSYRRILTPGINPPQVFEAYGDLHGYIRQDDEGVIHFRPSASDPESVYFDHNIGVGEVVPADWRLLQSSWYTEPVTVASIEVLTGPGGTPHRCYNFTTPGYPFSTAFIEGVGCVNDFDRLLVSSQGAPWKQLLCVAVDGTPFYPFEPSLNCPLALAIDETPEPDTGLSVHPNPTHGPLTVVWEREGPAQWVLTDHCGRIILQGNYMDGAGHTMDLEDLPSEVYILAVERSGDSARTRVTKTR